MGSTYALAPNAFGFCDRCSQRWPLPDLKYQWVNRLETKLKVCPECMDIDHEQLRLDTIDAVDPMRLNDPRPDTSIGAGRSIYGWNPVTGLTAKALLGQIGITT